MELLTKVLVYGVSNLHDARYCAGMGVDWIGFQTDSTSEKAIGEDAYAEIAGWLSGSALGIVCGSNFNDAPADFYVEIANTKQSGENPCFKLVQVDAEEELQRLIDGIATYKEYEAIIVTSEKLAINDAVSALLTELSSNKKTILGFGVDAQNAKEIIDKLPIEGIALMPGDEEKTGFNDFEELADLLEEIEVLD